jgi:hypothetical protein
MWFYLLLSPTIEVLSIIHSVACYRGLVQVIYVKDTRLCLRNVEKMVTSERPVSVGLHKALSVCSLCVLISDGNRFVLFNLVDLYTWYKNVNIWTVE